MICMQNGGEQWCVDGTMAFGGTKEGNSLGTGVKTVLEASSRCTSCSRLPGQPRSRPWVVFEAPSRPQWIWSYQARWSGHCVVLVIHG